MSNNLDEYRVPIPQGSEPEEEPPQGSRKFLWFVLAIILLAGIGIGAFLFFRPDEPEQVNTVEEDIEQVDSVDSIAEESVQATPETEPAVEPVEPTAQNFDHNRIAFINPEDRLVTINPDGSDQRVLTEPGRFYQFPAWSPEGGLIATIGSNIEDSGVFILADRPDPELRQLYAQSEDTPIYLHWAPDGQQVSFIAQHPDGLALHLAPADGTSGSEILATGPGSFFWNWLPDSQQIFLHTGFRAQEGDVTRLAFVPVEPEGEEREVLQNGFFQVPGVSNDGIYYSYSDTDPTGRHWLSVWNFEDGKQERLVGHLGVVAMGWNPTRPQLAYTSPATVANTFYGPLRLLDLETGDNRLLFPGVVLAFFWSPDGQSIAFLTLDRIEEAEEEQARANTLLFASQSLSQGEPQPVQAERKIFLNSWVLDLDEEEPRPLITFEPTDIFLNQFLPFFDQYTLSHRLWSPDSTKLVLPIQDEEDQDVLVVVPVNGDEPLVIAEGEVGFWSQQ